MKVSARHLGVDPEHDLLACFDVSKAPLNLYTHLETAERVYRVEDRIDNSTAAIEHVLARLRGIADEAGLAHLRVLCEPTGYEQKLLRSARRLVTGRP